LLSLDGEDPDEMTQPIVLRHPKDRTMCRTLQRSATSKATPLLKELLRDGTLVYNLPHTEEIRERSDADLAPLTLE